MGLAIQASQSYEGFAYFRTTGPINVTVGLYLGLKAVAFKEICIPQVTNWTKYSFTLTPTQTSTTATFTISMVPDIPSFRRNSATCERVAEMPANDVSLGIDMVFLQTGAWGR